MDGLRSGSITRQNATVNGVVGLVSQGARSFSNGDGKGTVISQDQLKQERAYRTCNVRGIVSADGTCNAEDSKAINVDAGGTKPFQTQCS